MTNHRTRSLLTLGGSLVLSAALAALAPAAGTGQPPANPAAASSANAELPALLNSLKKPGLSADQRNATIDKILAMGSDASLKLANQLARDLDTRTNAYLSKYERSAADVIQKRVKEAGGSAKAEADVTELRKKVVDVARGKGLTKEQIHDISDPAMTKLNALLIVTTEDVMKAGELEGARKELLDLATAYHTAAAKVDSDKRKTLTEMPPVETVEQLIANREDLSALLATPMSKADKTVLQANVPVAAKIDPQEAAGILKTNRIRIVMGIGALMIDTKLCDAARGHSKDMVEKNFFAHESPIPGKETPWKRAKIAGTSASAENIYEGSKKGEDAIKAWWYSPGHHQNMTATHSRIGLGRHEGKFTQMFG